MQTIHRLLVGVALLLWLALPVVSSDGGENAGATGVWILPRAVPLVANQTAGAPRAVHSCNNLSQDIVMVVSDDCGSVVATLMEEISGVSTALSVSGTAVRCSSQLLQSLLASGIEKVHIVISDSSQIGYVVQVVLNPAAGTASLRAY